MECHLVKVDVRFVTHDKVQDALNELNSLNVLLFLRSKMIAVNHLGRPPLDSILQVEHAELIVSNLDIELLFD